VILIPISAPVPVPGVPGAEVREVASLPDTLQDAVRVGGWTMARPGALLQKVPCVAKFLVTDGKLIEMVRDEAANALVVEQYLSGSARAALIHQRGGLPLHAASLVPPGKDFAIAISGPSGAGKSTPAMELVRRGWSLLGDDVTPLYADPGPVMAWPSKTGLKLWRDACDRFVIAAESMTPLPDERDKYLLPVVTQQNPVMLRYIFLLERGDSEDLLPVDGPSRLVALTENTYKPHYLVGMGCIESHFYISCHVSEQAKLSILRWSGSVARTADLLTQHSGL